MEFNYIEVIDRCFEIIQASLKIIFDKFFYEEYNNQFQDKLQSEFSELNKRRKYPVNNPDSFFYLTLFQKNFSSLSKALSSPYSLTLTYSLIKFKNQIDSKNQISLRQIYRFVDETEAFLEEIGLNKVNLSQIETARRNLINKMNHCDDNEIVINMKKSYNDLNNDTQNCINYKNKLTNENNINI